MSVLNASLRTSYYGLSRAKLWIHINGNLCINYFSGRRPLEFGQIYASWNIGLTIVTEKYIACCWKKIGKNIELDGASVSALSLFPYPNREEKVEHSFRKVNLLLGLPNAKK